jgi:hypothetical protein
VALQDQVLPRLTRLGQCSDVARRGSIRGFPIGPIMTIQTMFCDRTDAEDTESTLSKRLPPDFPDLCGFSFEESTPTGTTRENLMNKHLHPSAPKGSISNGGSRTEELRRVHPST